MASNNDNFKSNSHIELIFCTNLIYISNNQCAEIGIIRNMFT